MFTIKQPSQILFGVGCVNSYNFPKNSLVVTSKGAKDRGWLTYARLDQCQIFDSVESNPSLETAEKIIKNFGNKEISAVIGIGGGSVLDVAKFVAHKLHKIKIMVPTTFGSGSEVTRISVLKVDGKKKSFHDDDLFADVALVDPTFAKTTHVDIIKNSAIDALAQCSEGYDSKIGNMYTRFMCEKAFGVLEEGILNNDHEKIAFGSLLSGLGFGNCSTTLGHALSYVFSNEGISHGHALAFTTTVAHRFNNSIFYERFTNIVKKLKFKEILLHQNIDMAADLILTDRKHLDNNPKNVTKDDVISLLKQIVNGRTFD